MHQDSCEPAPGGSSAPSWKLRCSVGRPERGQRPVAGENQSARSGSQIAVGAGRGASGANGARGTRSPVRTTVGCSVRLLPASRHPCCARRRVGRSGVSDARLHRRLCHGGESEQPDPLNAATHRVAGRRLHRSSARDHLAAGSGGRSMRPSSSSCPGSTGEGASSMRSEPDEVLGKAMTSRMLVWSVSSAIQRSTPRAMPP